LLTQVYDRQRFTSGNFRHYDLYFPDGSCPSEAILLKWLEIAESEPGAHGGYLLQAHG
jgi:cell division cycle 14